MHIAVHRGPECKPVPSRPATQYSPAVTSRPGPASGQCRKARLSWSELHQEGTGVGERVRVVRLVASVRGKLRVITDTDAPRSVVQAVGKTGEGRLRSASGSGEWLGPARWCGIAVAARPWCGLHPGCRYAAEALVPTPAPHRPGGGEDAPSFPGWRGSCYPIRRRAARFCGCAGRCRSPAALLSGQRDCCGRRTDPGLTPEGSGLRRCRRSRRLRKPAARWAAGRYWLAPSRSKPCR